jgi:hypothetical protein
MKIIVIYKLEIFELQYEEEERPSENKEQISSKLIFV